MIYIIDDFLSLEDLEYYKDYINKHFSESNVFVSNEDMISTFWKKYKEKIQSKVDITGLTNRITMGKSNIPIPKHTDRCFENEKYKLLIYLNNVPNGGTVFLTQPPQKIENKANRLVIFDMSLLHKGECFSGGQIKYTIGFRAK